MTQNSNSNYNHNHTSGTNTNTNNNNINHNNRKHSGSQHNNSANQAGAAANNNTGPKKDLNDRKDGNSRSNFRRNNKNDFYRKPQPRYNSENLVSRIANPRREETVEDIQMDIEKLEKDIQFEIKQIRSVKLGL